MLREFDANHDNKIDAADSLWNNLQLWVDSNHDGFTDAGEIHSLAEYNVQSLSTTITFHKGATDANGNLHEAVGTYTRIGGALWNMTDVMFRVNFEDTVAKTWVVVPADIAALPDVQGSGTVDSLQQAMARDASGALKGFVQGFIGANDPVARAARGKSDQRHVRPIGFA